MLAELGGADAGPTEDKLLLVFKVLDQLVPHLGVFSSIMKLCRNELFGKLSNSVLISELIILNDHSTPRCSIQ
jgi:hypothetical protein